VLGERLHRLARRRPQRVAGRLEPAVVEGAPVAQLLEQLGRDPHADAAQRGGGDARAPRRQQRRERLAQQRGDLGEHEHAIAGGVVDAREVVGGRVLERAGDVVLVDELVARVEAEDRRYDGQRQES